MKQNNMECPNCAALLKPDANKKMLTCDYCGASVVNPIFEKPVSHNRLTNEEHEEIRAALGLDAEKYETFIQESEARENRGGGVWRALRISLIFLIPIAGISYLVLSRSDKAESTPPAPASGDTAPETAVDPQAAKDAKLKAYAYNVDVSHGKIVYFMESYKDHLKDRKEPPTCNEPGGWSFWAIQDWTDVMERVHREQQKLPPAMPELAREVAEFLTEYQAMHPLAVETIAYFKDDAYKLDDCAKAQRMHPKLMARYAAFNARYQAVYDLLVKLGKGNLRRCLERTATAPEHIVMHQWANLLQKGREALDVFRVETRKDAPDLARIKQEIAVLKEVVDTLESFSDEQKRLMGYDHTRHREARDLIESAMDFMEGNGGKKAEEVLANPDKYMLVGGLGPNAAIKGSFRAVTHHFNRVIEGFFKNKVCGVVQKCTVDGCPDW